MTTPKTPQELDRKMIEAFVDRFNGDDDAYEVSSKSIAWRDQNPGPEVLALVDALKKVKNQRTRGYPTWQEWEIIWKASNEALAQWEASRAVNKSITKETI